jgi:hypothetical protein
LLALLPALTDQSASWDFLKDENARAPSCGTCLPGHPPPDRDRAEGEGEMMSYNPDPNLPDDLSVDQVRFPHRIKWALVAAGFKTAEAPKASPGTKRC